MSFESLRACARTSLATGQDKLFSGTPSRGGADSDMLSLGYPDDHDFDMDFPSSNAAVPDLSAAIRADARVFSCQGTTIGYVRVCGGCFFGVKMCT